MQAMCSVRTSEAPAAVGPYSQARWAGNMLFLSGQLGVNPASGELAGPGVEEQARQAMLNLQAVLKAAGLAWGQVIKATIFLADMNDFAAVNQVYASFFSGCPDLPARACVQVAALPRGGRVEIEAVAHKEA